MPAAKGDWKLKLIGPIITVLIVLLGFAGSWFTIKANVGELKVDQQRIESKVDQNEKDITNIKIEDASSSQVIKNIGDTLGKIEQQTSQIPQIQADLESLKDRMR